MRGPLLPACSIRRLLAALLVPLTLAACSQIRPVSSTAVDPINDFMVSPLAGDAPLLVSAQWDLHPSAVDCQLGFGAAPVYRPASCGPGSHEHTFGVPGIYQVTLVAEHEGETFERTITINVTDPGDPSQNHSPLIASFTASPDSGAAPLLVSLQWEVSDPDGDELTCRLVTGDGTVPSEVTDCANDDSLAHTFQQPGSYDVSMTVSDGRGGSATRVVTITATDAGGGVPPNEKPVIEDVTVTPTDGVAPLETTVGWNATDPDGDTLYCVIDFGDGSSQVVDPCGGVNEVKHVYATPGHYTVTLTVSDGNGGSATREGSTNVTVMAAVLLSTGTSLLNVDSDDSRVLDSVVPALTGQPIGAAVISWDTLAGADVAPLALVEELETLMSVSGRDAVLGADITIDELLTGLEAELSGLPAAGEIAALRNELLGLGGTFTLDALFDLDAVPAAELSAVLEATEVNVLDLALASLQLHSFLHADPSSPLQVALPIAAGFEAASSVSATLSVTSPPQLLLAREGATFSTAGLRLLLDVDLVSLDEPLVGPALDTLELLLSVPLLALLGYLDADVVLSEVELYLDLAPGTGTVSEVDPLGGSITLDLVPGVTEARLGRLSPTDRMSYFDGAPLSDLTFDSAPLGAVNLTVLHIVTDAEIGSVALDIGATAAATTAGLSPGVRVIDSFPTVASLGVSATAIGELMQSLLTSTELSLEVGTSSGAIGSLVSLLSSLLADVLDALVVTLDDIVAGLPLDGVLTFVVDPVLGALGLDVGEVSVTARQLVAP